MAQKPTMERGVVSTTGGSESKSSKKSDEPKAAAETAALETDEPVAAASNPEVSAEAEAGPKAAVLEYGSNWVAGPGGEINLTRDEARRAYGNVDEVTVEYEATGTMGNDFSGEATDKDFSKAATSAVKDALKDADDNQRELSSITVRIP